MNSRIVLRRAFTMLELIFVIVILGIVSSIGASIIAQVYESYIIQRGQYKANIKTELALNQIANRLRYAIPSTIGARKTLTPLTTYIPLDLVTDPNMKVLQWVGYDGDSFNAINSSSSTGAARRPGWSGFCDVAASSNSALSTPGSYLDLASTIISNLGGSISNAELYFAEGNGVSYGVASGTGETITMDGGLPSNTMISERYKLAWSSYALEVDPNDDLILHYNFTPVSGTGIANQQSSVLLRNVTNFRFKYSGGAFRLKICKQEQIGMNATNTIHACKEKVVF